MTARLLLGPLVLALLLSVTLFGIDSLYGGAGTGARVSLDGRLTQVQQEGVATDRAQAGGLLLVAAALLVGTAALVCDGAPAAGRAAVAGVAVLALASLGCGGLWLQRLRGQLAQNYLAPDELLQLARLQLIYVLAAATCFSMLLLTARTTSTQASSRSA